MIKNGTPVTAIDPLGIWWGLRVPADPSKNGLPVVIFGGAHQDIPLPIILDKQKRPQVDEEKLKLLIKSMLESRISAVIDTSEFSKHLQRRIGAIVCDAIFRQNAPYGDRHVFIEETDMLAPQSTAGELGFSKGAVDDLIRRGGNFNIGGTIISQRSAVVNKDILTQCNCLIVLRVQAKLDKDAVKTWVENVVADDAERRKLAKWYDSLKTLEKGEAWVYSPANNIPLTKIKFRERETLHATREYFRQEGWKQKNIRMLDVDQFVEKFKSIFAPKPKAKQQAIEQPVQRPAVHAVAPPRMGWDESQRVKTYLSHPAALQNPTMGLPDTIVQQSVPTVEIHQTKPTVRLPVEALDEPTSPLGRTIVALRNDAQAGGRQDAWTRKKIRDHVSRHSWPIEGVDEAIDQLIRWEILKVAANAMIRFYPHRVQLVEKTNPLEVR
jgi:hypothetical protein